MSAERGRAPLFVLGIDAGDPDLIEGWAREGHLPTIASIMERGRFGRTVGPELISEHGVWVGLFSGLSRSQHGYYYFRQLRPGTYDLVRRAGHHLGVRPFWAGLGDRRSLVVDAPDIDLVPGLPGLQLSNWASYNNWDPDHSVPSSEPPELLSRVRSSFGEKLLTREYLDTSPARDRTIFRQVMERIRTKGALCRELLGSDESDLVVMVFGESHVADHQFWSYHRAGEGGRSAEPRLRHAIRDVYGAIDREIGLLLEAAPADANVVIVSSVGMVDDYPTTGLIESFLRRLGYQASPPPGGGGRSPMDLLRRWVPEPWRIALSRHFSRAVRERLLARQFLSGTDWSATTAFAIPSAYTSFIRVNLRGREPSGTVAPGEEYRDLLDRLEADLRRLVDPLDGRPAVTRIARSVDLFDCGPHDELPDLFIDWKPGRFMQRVVHPSGEITQQKPDFFRRSDHSASGFVAAAGGAIRRGAAPLEVSLLDVAPTLLSLLGAPPAPEMRGSVIDELVSSPAQR